ncbi:aldo/keto reductase [Candidatus Bathyarchaeota archaeon]|nr:aldo/keto reductase [Candidatus Bathyarchaeota archaeon]
MKYRKFGKLGFKVSVLGFGAMRLPVVGSDHSNIDEPKAIEMMRYAIDHGVNYIDTAYGYHGGKSEVVVGKALMDGYRERVKLATKMPTWAVNSQDDMDRILNEQLTRLQTDHVDIYLLHGLGKERWEKMKNLNVLEWAEKAVADGRIRGLGFSFHDEFEVLKEIIDSYDKWVMCQILYNYIDQDRQAGTRGLKYAASKGLAVVIMEPIGGGTLAVTPPKEIQAIWDEAKTKRSQVEWALQWVWNHPEVTVALSGMSTMQQVVENIKSANRSGPGKLTKQELQIIERVRQKYAEYGFIGCTSCRYCMPCPNGVAIPEIFALFNLHFTKRGDRNAEREVASKYMETVGKEKGVKNCKKCGRCEELCPQHLPIRNLLARAEWTFERPPQ